MRFTEPRAQQRLLLPWRTTSPTSTHLPNRRSMGIRELHAQFAGVKKERGSSSKLLLQVTKPARWTLGVRRPTDRQSATRGTHCRRVPWSSSRTAGACRGRRVDGLLGQSLQVRFFVIGRARLASCHAAPCPMRWRGTPSPKPFRRPLGIALRALPYTDSI